MPYCDHGEGDDIAATSHIDLLTAQEVARVLRVNKNTVYGLAKTGELRSLHVGRKLRFALDDVQTYITAERSDRTTSARSAAETAAPHAAGAFVIGGHDMILDMLANYLSAAGVHVLRSYRSGYEELVALYFGRVQAAAIHLWDGSTGAYNLPYVKRVVPGTPVVVLHLARRSQGLLVQRDNPLDLHKWSDLVHRDVVLANRERGSGSRILLDEQLRLLEAHPYVIRGYARELTSDLVQGTLISQGGADVGVGTERVFHQIDGLDYEPLQTEHLALVIAKTPATQEAIRATHALLSSQMFRHELIALPGYDFTHMGSKLYET